MLRFKFPPYHHQGLAVECIADFFANAGRGDRLFITSPTGSGKSGIALLAQQVVEDVWVITPRTEIIVGMLDKGGVDVGEMSEAKLIKFAFDNRITTPLRLYNALMKGEIDTPSRIIFDEAHHELAKTWKDIGTLCDQVPRVGLSGTYFRGTPQSTRELHELWGEAVEVMTYQEAAEMGIVHIPKCETVPLLNDDIISVKNGDFETKQVVSETESRLEDIVKLASQFADGKHWDRPTFFALPGTEICSTLKLLMNDRGLSADVITQKTTYAERQRIIRDTIEGRTSLLQINVVSEGVDAPFRRMIDCDPAMSPVEWLQRFGRLLRPLKPDDMPSHYVCTNCNLLRHGYLLDGLIPADVVKVASTMFEGLGKRSSMRVLGLESLGRFKPVDVKLRDGSYVAMYALSAMEGNKRVDYAVIISPNRAEPQWAKKTSKAGEDGKLVWGDWRSCKSPSELTGFSSMKPNPLTDNQKRWWNKCAKRYNIDPEQKVNAKLFQILPVLDNTGIRI